MLQRQSRSLGYFAADRFRSRRQKTPAHELALNPASFTNRTDAEIVSTLVHEQVHVWQHHKGSGFCRE
jgi:predicted SprT family Zn-dependent metalloprotease